MPPRFLRSRTPQAVLAVALAAAIAAPVAMAASGGSGDGGPPDAKAQLRRLAALRERAGGLVDRVAALKKMTESLEAQRAAAAPTAAAAPRASSVRSAALTGSAGGALTGTYPNPLLAGNSVGTNEIADGSIRSADIMDRGLFNDQFGDESATGENFADFSLDSFDFFNHSFRASRDLKHQFAYPPASVTNPGLRGVIPGGVSVATTISCPPGTRALSGGWEWGDLTGKGTVILASQAVFDNTSWEIVAKIEPGGTVNTIYPEVLCLEA